MSNEDTSTTTVSLERDVYNRVQSRVSDSEFSSVDEYVNFVIEEVISEIEGTGSMTDEKDEEVKDRLEQLGYLE